MASLNELKEVLLQDAKGAPEGVMQPLSPEQYNAGFDILRNASSSIYNDFIIPELSRLVARLLKSRVRLSILEIGPGPSSVVTQLPDHLRRRIGRYVAMEPNEIHAGLLKEELCAPESERLDVLLPGLEHNVDVHTERFSLDLDVAGITNYGQTERHEKLKFDMVLFSHGMSGMTPEYKFVVTALQFLSLSDEMVVIFGRDGLPYFGGLPCSLTKTFANGLLSVSSETCVVDTFASFIAGYDPRDARVPNDSERTIRERWRTACYEMGTKNDTSPTVRSELSFRAPARLAVFTRGALSLRQLMDRVPYGPELSAKSYQARQCTPAVVMKPTDWQGVQRCVLWAVKHRIPLTVVGGTHGDFCVQPDTVAIDMSALKDVYVADLSDSWEKKWAPGPVIVAGSGSKTGDIIREAKKRGMTVPLPARPSVGLGSWVQGGIGHLARLYGLACDSIVGVHFLDVNLGRARYAGFVPQDARLMLTKSVYNVVEVLRSFRGAGTNLGIVLSLTFRTYNAPKFAVHSWVLPISNREQHNFRAFRLDVLAMLAAGLSREESVDVYLFSDSGGMKLGIALVQVLYDSTNTTRPSQQIGRLFEFMEAFGTPGATKLVDGLSIFDTEMYMSMHGGHGSGKFSAFKRCIFLKDIAAPELGEIFIRSLTSRPSAFCYLQLQQGGGKLVEVQPDESAFGVRDWTFACVVTGVWPRSEDGTALAHYTIDWVYKVVYEFLPLSSGVYTADLGPDPRDVKLASRAFGPDLSRLARIKQELDPNNILPYACPLPKAYSRPMLIVAVTGKVCAGKDFCANYWSSYLNDQGIFGLKADVQSISKETKEEYAAATGAELYMLHQDREYKEKHRDELTRFYQAQVERRPRLPEENFLKLVVEAMEEDVSALFVTGMRDEALVARFSHLVPNGRLIEVHITVDEGVRLGRLAGNDSPDDRSPARDAKMAPVEVCYISSTTGFIFDNSRGVGWDEVMLFAKECLLPFFDEKLQELASMVHTTSDFPRPGVDFQHVLGISEHKGGLLLCTSLLETHLHGDWEEVDAIASCETGGFVFASALSLRVGVPLVLLRKGGKLPPPKLSTPVSSSHISSSPSSSVSAALAESAADTIEMGHNVVNPGTRVVVVDDVLASGETLCAVLELLQLGGVRARDIRVLVVAEFPILGGRELLHRRGFGGIAIRSLLVFPGA